MGNRKSKLNKRDLDELVELTRMSRCDIKSHFAEFIKDCPDGRLTLIKFKEIYKNKARGDTSQFAEHVFRIYDSNHDGYIDFKEFMLIASRRDLEDMVRNAFKMYDVDGNGYISRDEWREIIVAICRMTGDGQEAEWTSRADRLFHCLDKNSDGEISVDEFLDGAKRDPDLARLLQNKFSD